ncbi:MAG TPA: cytochrome c family protein [Rhodospirillaceae bacterium]|nr:cytochrome c family protein [Rhodospirillaceae bacterium]
MGITLQKISGAILLALILVVGLNLVVDSIMPPPPPREPPKAVAPAAKTAKSQPAAAAAAPAPELPLPQRLAKADAAKGMTVAKKCASCHVFNEGGGSKVGPNLYAVVGRPKAKFPGFAYSEVLKAQGGAWNDLDLDLFLTKPGAYAPGTKMGFAGLPDGQERADVIAYLRSISPDAPALSK